MPTSYGVLADAVSDAEPEHSPYRPRLERICRRAPRLETRATNLLERINGDESVRGSLLWLDAKAAEARDAGRDQLAVVIENRRNTREAAVGVIEVFLDEVGHIQGLCDENGIGW